MSSFGVSRAHTPSARPSTTTLHVQVPPLEGTKLLEKFLLKMSQLEVLRMEWGLRTLVVPSVSTQQQSALLEEVYTDKVLSWARKAVAKQQLRDAARMQLESVSEMRASTFCDIKTHEGTQVMGCIVKGINRIYDTDDAVALLQDLSSLARPYTLTHSHPPTFIPP